MVGKTEVEVEAYLKSQGLKMRVSEKDGQMVNYTDDEYCTDRVNVHITNNVVTGIGGIG